MIKATFKKNNRTLLFLGLSHENLERLAQHEACVIEGEDVGLPNVDVFIQGGETEETLAAELMSYFDPCDCGPEEEGHGN